MKPDASRLTHHALRRRFAVKGAMPCALCLVLFILACDQPPLINGITANPNPVQQLGTCTITADANSPMGEVLTYHWTVVEPGGGAVVPTDNPTTYTAPKLSGYYRVALRVLDSHARGADDTVEIQVTGP
jgi:hypothetical protein